MIRELERLAMNGYAVRVSADVYDGDFIFTVDVQSGERLDIETDVIVTVQDTILSEAIAAAYRQTPTWE